MTTDLGGLDVEAMQALVEKLIRTGDTRRLKTVRDQLKAAVDRRTALGRTERWSQDPAAWVSDRLGQIVWTKQREIMESVRDNRKTAVRSCHSSGKAMWLRSSWRGGSMHTRRAKPSLSRLPPHSHRFAPFCGATSGVFTRRRSSRAV